MKVKSISVLLVLAFVLCCSFQAPASAINWDDSIDESAFSVNSRKARELLVRPVDVDDEYWTAAYADYLDFWTEYNGYAFVADFDLDSAPEMLVLSDEWAHVGIDGCFVRFTGKDYVQYQVTLGSDEILLLAADSNDSLAWYTIESYASQGFATSGFNRLIFTEKMRPVRDPWIVTEYDIDTDTQAWYVNGKDVGRNKYRQELAKIRELTILAKFSIHDDTFTYTDSESWDAIVSQYTVLKGRSKKSAPPKTAKPRETGYTFVDPAAERIIRRALGKTTGTVTKRDLATLTVLDESSGIYNAGIRSVEDFQWCTGLKTLFLEGNPVSDIEPIEDLSLEVLSLHKTNVQNLWPLAGMTSLRDLSVSHTDVSDLEPLSGLYLLDNLYINSTNVTDISPIMDLDLENLQLSGWMVSSKQIKAYEKAHPSCKVRKMKQS
ncbi:MAG: hypothetical protein IKE30_02595 [Clostridia bacterium]|nr:hypothetical protein [Clostridia bacterium]